MELVVAEVQGGVDRLERLKVDRHFLLLVVLGQNRAAVDNKTEFGDPVVEFETLLGRFDG